MGSSALELMRSIPLFRQIPNEQLAEVHALRIEVPRGAVLFSQGEAADQVFAIITGRVKVVKHSPGGREVCLELLGPGDPIAALAAVRGIPYPASGIAVEPSACVKIPTPSFKFLVDRNPWLTCKVLEVVSQRLLDASEARLSLATEPVEARLAQTLLRLAGKYATCHNGELVFGAALTRQQLADLAGTTVESTIRVMSRWTRDGLLRSTSSRITVAQPEALKRLANRCEPVPVGAR